MCVYISSLVFCNRILIPLTVCIYMCVCVGAYKSWEEFNFHIRKSYPMVGRSWTVDTFSGGVENTTRVQDHWYLASVFMKCTIVVNFFHLSYSD